MKASSVYLKGFNKNIEILLWTFVNLGLYLYRTFPIDLLNGLGYKYQIGIDKYKQIENVAVFGIIAFGLIQE